MGVSGNFCPLAAWGAVMTSRAPTDPYTTTFTATVDAVDGSTVILDRTYFYAESGGQPADRGTIDGVDVIDVQYDDGDVVHELETSPPVEPGEEIEAAVDPEFRTYCMRAHTASHVLYGAGRRLLDDLGYGGFDIGEEKARVDFATTTDVDDELLVDLERLTNRAVWASHDVRWEQMGRESALEREDIAFNTKTEEGIDGETVRVVTVDDWDVAACGGTHVRNTREIGPVTVLERSNPGEGLTRVEFAVGPPAIQRRATERSRAMGAARALETSVDDLPGAVDRLQEEYDELRAEFDDLQETVVDSRIAALREEAVTKGDARWLVGELSGLDANELAERAQEVVGEDIDVAALVSDDGAYLAVATAGSVDAGDVVTRVTDEFGGGGGGSPTVAQGGGLDATAEDVVASLRDES